MQGLATTPAPTLALAGRLPPLRPYQIEAGRAILRSVLENQGLTFTVEIARQGGKNELSAQLEAYLLARSLLRGGDGIKAAPTFRPQLLTSLRRLRDRLADLGFGRAWAFEQGSAIRLGRARQLFLSAEPAAAVVGATASLLLEIDEAQDVDPDKFNRDFKPMGAATNVTTVLYGTAWDDSSLLEQAKQVNLELERHDGLRRHFQYDWEQVARYVPAYAAYVEAERQRLGADHPLFLTQYCLTPVQGGGRLLSPSQRAQLQGRHPRLHAPAAASDIYVAGIDVAGEAEDASDAALRRLRPRQDSTVVTIGRLLRPFDSAQGRQAQDERDRMGSTPAPEPIIQVVEQCWWTGRRHSELHAQLVDLLRRVWGCRRVVVDATGIGAGLASFLEQSLGSRVLVPFTFTAPSKSHLAFQLLAAVNAGSVQFYVPDGSPEHHECWQQLERARRRLRPNQTMDFYVGPAEGHDDFLMSLALAVEAANYRPRLAVGRPS